jgi:mRNA-degrading endonuclease RelE of RelBE toxin-antitoxin system
MDKIQKLLNSLSNKEKLKIKEILLKIKSKNLESLDIKKLKGREDIFRVRKEKLRIIFIFRK